MAFFDSICIDRYRGIKNLRIDELKQINLIVGDNNCGKTSVLEALQLLRTSATLANVYRVARQRDSLAVMGANSIFDSFLCMFPRDINEKKEISIRGNSDKKTVTFQMKGKTERVLLDTKELGKIKLYQKDIPDGEIETEAFEGELCLTYGDEITKKPVSVNCYSSVTGMAVSEVDKFNIVYVSPFEHLRGNVISKIIRKPSFKQVCIKALQLFDPEITDMMIFKSDVGDRPVEYLRHNTLGDMPISSYGDGIKRVLSLANAIALAADGILLIDELETAIHKKYYDNIFRFLVKACRSFHVQAFVTTHSIEAIDGLLATQDYNQSKDKDIDKDIDKDNDDIRVCTIKRDENGSHSRVLTGREVYENREAFGFEVRL